MKRSKSLAVKSRVVRRVKEIPGSLSWLKCVNEGGTPIAEDDEYNIELAYPELHKTRARRTARPWSLSRRQLRSRLSRLGYQGEALASLVKTLLAGGQNIYGETFSGWTREEAQEQFGRQVARELRRGVAGRFVMLDEMGYYMYPGFAQLVEQLNVLRKNRPAGADFVLADDDVENCADATSEKDSQA
jgi:hypothetical protein